MGLSNNPICRRCGVQKETSAHILCECEALASLRHVHLGSFFYDPEDIKILSLRAIWNLGKGTGLPWLDIRLWGTKSPSKGRGASGPQGLKPNYYLNLHLTDLEWFKGDFHKDSGRQPTC
jgi:hypothetical protein